MKPIPLRKAPQLHRMMETNLTRLTQDIALTCRYSVYVSCTDLNIKCDFRVAASSLRQPPDFFFGRCNDQDHASLIALFIRADRRL